MTAGVTTQTNNPAAPCLCALALLAVKTGRQGFQEFNLMASKMDVGRSSRTPVKHYLLDKALGKVCGVLSLNSNKVPCRASFMQPLICVDLCGGDGLSTDDHDASPVIMYRHCEWLCGKGKKATLHVIEKASNTFEALQSNCEGMSGEILSLSLSDARDYRLPKLNSDQAAFIHCDPNTVDQIPLSRPFVAGFSRYTTYLVTLGCNVGGLKMTTHNKRSQWFEYVNMLVDVLPSHHEVILFWLNSDSAQWAYLLSMPKVWAAEFASKAIQETAKVWIKGVSAVSYRDSRVAFNDQLRKLFLTKEEYGRE
jgi:hypothetical protein